MTKQEQLAALQCASEELDGYACSLSWDGILSENEAKNFDGIIEKIDKVSEEIRHETISPTYIYTVWEDWHGIIGHHKTFEGAKKQLMENEAYKELAQVPLYYDDETCWGWDGLLVERIELEK